MKQELYVNHSIVWLKGSTKVFTKPKKKKKKNSTQKIVTVSRIAWACDLLE